MPDAAAVPDATKVGSHLREEFFLDLERVLVSSVEPLRLLLNTVHRWTMAMRIVTRGKQGKCAGGGETRLWPSPDSLVELLLGQRQLLLQHAKVVGKRLAHLLILDMI